MSGHKRASVRNIVPMVSVLLLMPVLCGCRTRLTNNKEITRLVSDDNGLILESYNRRRDRLNLAVAEKPVLTGLPGGDNDNYDDSGDYDDFDTAVFDNYQSGGADDEESSDGTSASDSSGGSGASSGSGSGSGSCSKASVKVKYGSTYGSLPTAM